MIHTTTLKPYNIDSEKEREDFIISYIPYCNSIAKAISRQYGCNEFDELRSCGYQGLLDAVNKFDPAKNVSFKYYSYIRICGHMLDYMRKAYCGSNATVVLKKKINKVLDIKQMAGELLDSEMVAKELGMTLEEYQNAQTKINGETYVMNFSDLAGPDNADYNIADMFLANNGLHEDDTILIDQLWKIMANRFPKRDRDIMDLIYNHELTYPIIAEQFGISDRRVSQIHLDVLKRLKKLATKGIHTRNKEKRRKSVTVKV